ncbi:MAG: hypothetical protein RL660_3147 [Bacteroidota bacterium]|jgi:carboxyl-terminal processing protease
MKLVRIALVASLLSSQFAFAQTSSDDNLFEVSKNLDIYYALFKEVNQYYVDPTQPGKMVKTSIDAMLAQLDPYTNYYTEDDIEDYRFQNTGKYGGIGCGMRKYRGNLCFEDIIENGPLAKSGIKDGDIILEIDGKSVVGYSIDDVGKLIKGSPGTSIKMKVRNPYNNQETVKTITREEITIKNTSNSQLVGPNNNIAYVKLVQFTSNATANIRKELDSLKAAQPNLKGVILDLRYNPGGLLDEAVNLSNLFIGRDQLVVSTKGKTEEWNKERRTQNLPWNEDIPLVVLINKGSASASEIVSGTMQDLDRGVVIGQRSYGKGLVQNTRTLPFNAQVKITTAKYYTPSGRCIQALDYTNRNEDGSVGTVPDSVKREFKTTKGRRVFDGGGVDPDIKTESFESNRVVSALFAEGLIFDYANKYATEHATISDAKSFRLSDADIDAFITWLADKKYDYKTKTEDQIAALKTTAEKDNYLDDIQDQLKQLEAIVAVEKKKDLQAARKELKRALQAEIVSRYYYSNGKAANMLQDDVDLQEAISVLGDAARYGKLLGK